MGKPNASMRRLAYGGLAEATLLVSHHRSAGSATPATVTISKTAHSMTTAVPTEAVLIHSGGILARPGGTPGQRVAGRMVPGAVHS